MAKLATQNLVITISKVVRNDEDENLSVVTEDVAAALETVLVDLLQDSSLVVEVAAA